MPFIVLGDLGSYVTSRHLSKRPLRTSTNVYPPATSFRFREYAKIPTAFLKQEVTRDYYIHRSGKHILSYSRSDRSNVNIFYGSLAGYDKISGITHRVFGIGPTKISASRLVCAAFYGLPVDPYNFALHINRREEGVLSDDSVINVQWGTISENVSDATDDGRTFRGREMAVIGRPADAAIDQDEVKCGDSILVFDIEYDGKLWVSFKSLSDAGKKTANGLGKMWEVLSGHRARAKGWVFLWHNIDAPNAGDLRLVDKKRSGDRYLTRDGRLLVEKTDIRGKVFVEMRVALEPVSNYKNVTSSGILLRNVGGSLLHRYVMYLFNPEQVAAKEASTGLKFKDLVVDHIDRNRLDNSAANLRVLTKAENSAAAGNKRVAEFDDLGVQIGEWKSIKDAAAAVDLHPSNMSATIHGKRRKTEVLADGSVRSRIFKLIPN